VCDPGVLREAQGNAQQLCFRGRDWGFRHHFVVFANYVVEQNSSAQVETMTAKLGGARQMESLLTARGREIILTASMSLPAAP